MDLIHGKLLQSGGMHSKQENTTFSFVLIMICFALAPQKSQRNILPFWGLLFGFRLSLISLCFLGAQLMITPIIELLSKGLGPFQ